MITNSAGFSGAKPTMDVDDAEVDVVLRRGLLVALDEVRLARRGALERALPEQVVHERADVEADLRPQRLVVGLEHHPLRAPVEALLDEQRGAADRDVLPLVASRSAPCSVRAPQTTRPDAGNGPQAVDAERVELAVLGVGERHGRAPARR